MSSPAGLKSGQTPIWSIVIDNYDMDQIEHVAYQDVIDAKEDNLRNKFLMNIREERVAEKYEKLKIS